MLNSILDDDRFVWMNVKDHLPELPSETVIFIFSEQESWPALRDRLGLKPEDLIVKEGPLAGLDMNKIHAPDYLAPIPADTDPECPLSEIDFDAFWEVFTPEQVKSAIGDEPFEDSPDRFYGTSTVRELIG